MWIHVLKGECDVDRGERGKAFSTWNFEGKNEKDERHNRTDVKSIKANLKNLFSKALRELLGVFF